MEKNFNIHAMKVNSEWAEDIYDSIINDGEARFGWSYNNDLRVGCANCHRKVRGLNITVDKLINIKR